MPDSRRTWNTRDMRGRGGMPPDVKAIHRKTAITMHARAIGLGIELEARRAAGVPVMALQREAFACELVAALMALDPELGIDPMLRAQVLTALAIAGLQAGYPSVAGTAAAMAVRMAPSEKLADFAHNYLAQARAIIHEQLDRMA